MKSKQKNISLGLSFARARYSLIHNEVKFRKRAISEIKEALPYPELCNAVDYLTKNTHKNFQELIWGIPLPRSYAELGSVTEFSYVGKYEKGTWQSSSVNGELNMCLIGVRRFSYEINLFLKYKMLYDDSLLTGEYESAEKYLTKIENEICYSLWSLENRFVLKELSGKASESKEFLSYFNEINTSEGITKSLAHYLCLRAEHSLSINRYYNDLEMSLTNLKATDTKEAFQNYYRFKLTFLNHLNFENYAELISLDSCHSIIDRYLNLSKVLTNLLAVSNYLNDDDEKKITLKSYLHNRINYLLRKIEDPLLYKLKLFSGEVIFPAFDNQKSQTEIRIIDNYTTGLYFNAEKELAKLLLIKPCQFDLYILYVKSLVYQKKPFQTVGTKKSIQNEILQELYRLISVTTNPTQSSLNLLRIANNLASNQLSYGITDFVFFQTQGQKERNLLSKLSYNAANPIIHDIFTSDVKKLEYLTLLSDKFPDSITVDFFKEKIKGIEFLSKFEKKLPRGKYKLELARKLQANLNFIKAIDEWVFLIENYKDTPPILETAILNLFNCYIELDQIDNAINLYVESYFFNNYIVEKIETKNVLKKIATSKFRTVKKEINLPIFYTIVDADEVETHIAFELFNRAHNVEKPSQWFNKNNELSESKFSYYLEFTCSPKVLMHSTFIENSKERLEERLTILNFLKEKHSSNKNILAEIKSIQNILVIQRGLIDLDESKIYVNEQGILENELQEFIAVFERFQVIAGITGNNKLLYLADGKLTTYASQEDTELEKIEYSNNPVFDIYLELFNAVKDKFLNSQFGIVAYLSTRIRHGVLVGELRPIFETHNLITLKEGKSSKYRRNTYWDFIYTQSNQSTKEQIQILLSDFAAKIDSIIFDLIKKHLQVFKPGLNDEGWFNYEFDPNHLWYHSVAASIYGKDFNTLINGMFDILWERTDENLTVIREKIQQDVLGQFNYTFDELERRIIEQLGVVLSEPLLKAIKDCSTEIQTVIQKISRWFKRSQIKASDFNLSEVINIIAEYTNKGALHKRLVITKEVDFDCRIKGAYKTHFADLIRIFLENIIKHSSERSHEICCKISATQENEETLKIIISNQITDESTIDSLRTIWKNDTPDTSKLLNEGKSGYHKAFKILTSDLRCPKIGCLDASPSNDNKEFVVTLCINIKELKA
jgi:hypothetical protein